MSSKIEKDLEDLAKAGVVTREVAEKIRRFYQEKQKKNSIGFLLPAFSILGSLLIGGGAILLLAHNWTDFGRPLRVFLSFLPLLTAQVLTLYAAFFKKESNAWKEGSGIFLFLSIGIAISLIGQTYHISGNLPAFFATWMLLGLPVAYLTGAVGPAVLYLGGFLGWAFAAQEEVFLSPGLGFYWPLLLLVAPFGVQLWRREKNGLRLSVLLWVFSAVFLISQALLLDKVFPGFWVPHYAALFSLFLLAGSLPVFRSRPLLANPFFALGSLGTIVFLMVLSFNEPWNGIHRLPFDKWIKKIVAMDAGEMVNAALILAGALVLWGKTAWERRKADLLWGTGFVLVSTLYAVTFFQGKTFPSHFIVNLFLVAIGIVTLVTASRQNKIGLLNYGMLILSTVILFRFFDENISFLLRGTAFMLIGAAFLTFNILFVRRRKSRASEST